jgi:two-component system alkaline phosphatase synthesis response regulator PhoP
MANKVILIIDDEKEVCRIAKEALERLGDYKVLAAYDGNKGLDIAKQAKPDLVLLDLDLAMPSMNGFQVLESLKNDNETYHIPVVMLTAQHDDAFRIAASRLYSEEYITKPVSVTELKTRIDTILARFGV